MSSSTSRPGRLKAACVNENDVSWNSAIFVSAVCSAVFSCADARRRRVHIRLTDSCACGEGLLPGAHLRVRCHRGIYQATSTQHLDYPRKSEGARTTRSTRRAERHDDRQRRPDRRRAASAQRGEEHLYYPLIGGGVAGCSRAVREFCTTQVEPAPCHNGRDFCRGGFVGYEQLRALRAAVMLSPSAHTV